MSYVQYSDKIIIAKIDTKSKDTVMSNYTSVYAYHKRRGKHL